MPLKTVDVRVTDANGKPLGLVMVTLKSVEVPAPQGTDQFTETVLPWKTAFTGQNGTAKLLLPAIEDAHSKYLIRLRKNDYSDTNIGLVENKYSYSSVLPIEPNRNLAIENRPANAWQSAIDLGDEELKNHFKLQCAFCHQQGSLFTRAERSPEEWSDVITRMVQLGSRLHNDAQANLPELLQKEHARLRNDPSLIPDVNPWEPHLPATSITEWPIGTRASQLHDMLWADGKLWVGDNLQDNLIELDPATNQSTIHKIPHKEGDTFGGNIGGRLSRFPGAQVYVGLHSLEDSKKDGHIFMTGSDSTRLVEFAPETGEFTLYDIPEGYYPHTIRIDSLDRVWFTMAVSNQIAMFNRETQEFKFWDLPSRTFMESVTIFLMPVILKLSEWGVPFYLIPINPQSQGLPMPYGIEITPDDQVWFTRILSDEIGHIDPESEELTMIKTPFTGPRRLRADKRGDLWITSFPEAKIARYTPADQQFKIYELPIIPKGSETPYSINVDRKRDIVWITGTASDTMISLDIQTEKWKIYPMPSRHTFTRDVVIAEDGSVYTSNGSFPTWFVEGGVPTAIRIIPEY
jgi:virginiamycin B lyase